MTCGRGRGSRIGPLADELLSVVIDGLLSVVIDGLLSVVINGLQSVVIDGLLSVVIDGLQSVVIEGLLSVDIDGLPKPGHMRSLGLIHKDFPLSMPMPPTGNGKATREVPGTPPGQRQRSTTGQPRLGTTHGSPMQPSGNGNSLLAISEK